MIKRFLSILIIACITLTITSFKDYNVNTIEATQYIVDLEASYIEWKGFKPTGSHEGKIKLSEGSFEASGNRITSGSFAIDMASLKEVNGNARLEGHLKSGDFFDVEKFPNATFVVKGINDRTGKAVLIGDLTLKDKTNTISFPVNVTNNEGSFSFSSETFTINRSKWNVKYGSKSFFDNLGDKFISDDIELKINIVAKAK